MTKFTETPYPTEPEDDVQNRDLPPGTQFTARIDEDTSSDDLFDSISYSEIARTFIEVLLDHPPRKGVPILPQGLALRGLNITDR
jgi:hypothetical protein